MSGGRSMPYSPKCLEEVFSETRRRKSAQRPKYSDDIPAFPDTRSSGYEVAVFISTLIPVDSSQP